MSGTALSVNLNKIALIRNSRPGNYPDVVQHGLVCLQAGAHGLTVHPRPDQRHIRPGDVHGLAELLQDYPRAEYNIEGNPFAESIGDFPGFMTLVKAVKPHQCTLVPDSNDQLTSDHGFDLRLSADRLKPVIRELKDLGVRISLFMDPEPEQIRRAAGLGVERIELYTGPWAEAFKNTTADLDELFERYRAAAQLAGECGMAVNAGHDLNLENLPRFLSIPQIAEVSIGHALTVDALAMGLSRAVSAYLAICGAENPLQEDFSKVLY